MVQSEAMMIPVPQTIGNLAIFGKKNSNPSSFNLHVGSVIFCHRIKFVGSRCYVIFATWIHRHE